jgi:hypothetical protein
MSLTVAALLLMHSVISAALLTLPVLSTVCVAFSTCIAAISAFSYIGCAEQLRALGKSDAVMGDGQQAMSMGIEG